MSSYYQLTSPLTLHANPVNPMHAVTKRYIDAKVLGVDGSRFVTGVIAVAKLPALIGDISTVAGSNVLNLNNSGVTAGVYNSIAVDSKGRVTSGAFVTQDTSNLDWSVVQTKPTTLGGYGITDVVSTVDGDTVASISMSAVQSTAGGAAVTRATVDTSIAAVDLSGVLTGEVVRRPVAGTPTGFLRSNGGILDKTTYAALYAIIGDSYTSGVDGYMGQPWRQQYAFNPTDNGVSQTWTTATALPGTVTYSQAIVIKNRVYLLGGYNGSASATVYTAPINTDGTLGTWTTATALPATVHYSQAIVTKNRVYLLGGVINGADSAAVYTAPINTDGTLGTWTTATALPATVAASQAIVTNSRVYLLGGVINGAYSSTVYTAPINTDGTLGTWTTATALPGTVAISQAIVTKNRVYLLGGAINGATSSTVYTAPINADGTLGTWTTATALPATVHYSQAIVTKNRVYLLGGATNSGASSTVYTAPINADGTLGTWTTATALPATVYYSQAIVTKSRVYLLGGYINDVHSATVYTAPFAGGTNDYLTLIANNTIDTTTQFKLPDYTTQEADGFYYYVKY